MRVMLMSKQAIKYSAGVKQRMSEVAIVRRESGQKQRLDLEEL